tara:strand:+ start:494 stop:787 length:294 start_codon:yes stop_codon:yes gene_type:complete
MTIQEIMERTGLKNYTLAKAYINDAIHLLQSSSSDTVKVSYSNITVASDGDDNQYDLPADLISLKNISVKDTQDSRYKKIKRLVTSPTVAEDTSPST